MFGISGEHLLVLGIILLIFGPRRLPELGSTLGKAIRNFKDSMGGVEEAAFRRTEERAPTTPVTLSEVHSDQIPLPLTVEQSVAKPQNEATSRTEA